MRNDPSNKRRIALVLAAWTFIGQAAVTVALGVHWSRNGEALAVGAGPKAVEVYDAAGRFKWRKDFGKRVLAFELSPDGSKLACVLHGDGLLSVALATGQETALRKLAPGQLGSSLAWSPDGKTIVFSVLVMDEAAQSLDPDQRPRMFLIRADGGSEVELKP